MIYIGIDSGNTGAIVVLGDDGAKVNLLFASHAVTIDIGKTKKISVIDPKWILGCLRPFVGQRGFIFIEGTNARRGEAANSAFTYGMGHGEWLMALTALGFEYERPFPQTWGPIILKYAAPTRVGDVMREENLDKVTKAQAMVICEDYLPSLSLFPTSRHRKRHTGLADAGAIALACFASHSALGRSFLREPKLAASPKAVLPPPPPTGIVPR